MHCIPVGFYDFHHQSTLNFEMIKLPVLGQTLHSCFVHIVALNSQLSDKKSIITAQKGKCAEFK
jgi:hypothetical protein